MQKKMIVIIASVAMLLSAVPAFAGENADKAAPAPVPINETKDLCAKCFMAVKDNGYAVQLIAKDGATYKFDDIGCFFKHGAANPAILPAARYAQDADTKKWIALDAAFFVSFKGIKTPMGYGIHAFDSKQRAEAFTTAHEGAKIVSIHELPSIEPSMKMHETKHEK